LFVLLMFFAIVLRRERVRNAFFC